MNDSRLITVGIKLVGLLTIINGITSIISILANEMWGSQIGVSIPFSGYILPLLQIIIGFICIYSTDTIYKIMNYKKSHDQHKKET